MNILNAIKKDLNKNVNTMSIAELSYIKLNARYYLTQACKGIKGFSFKADDVQDLKNEIDILVEYKREHNGRKVKGMLVDMIRA